jgi:Xaa-Pro aminopeptidase
MALHFERREFAERMARAALHEPDLAALLIFAQESHCYLTGFDSAGHDLFRQPDPRMVLFLHAILVDASHNLAMSLGHTIVVTGQGCRVL